MDHRRHHSFERNETTTECALNVLLLGVVQWPSASGFKLSMLIFGSSRAHSLAHLGLSRRAQPCVLSTREFRRLILYGTQCPQPSSKHACKLKFRIGSAVWHTLRTRRSAAPADTGYRGTFDRHARRQDTAPHRSLQVYFVYSAGVRSRASCPAAMALEGPGASILKHFRLR